MKAEGVGVGMTSRVYLVPRAVVAPAVLSFIAVVIALQGSWWSLAAVPFIWLASACSQPNLNLADGCLAGLLIVVGFVLLALFPPVGLPVFLGSAGGYYASAIEKWLRVRPAGGTLP